MMVRMKDELGLSQQQYEQVLPKVEERERSRQATFRARRERMQKLRESLAREGTKDSELTDAVDGIVTLEDSERKQDAALLADLRKILSPRQQAQLLFFRQRFRQWVEGRMRDAQELRQRYGRPGAEGRGGAGGAPPSGGDGEAPGPESPAPDRP
jgi:Spy/CpxP family protein refolding chaperone